MSTTPYDFNSPVSLLFNELLKAVMHNFTTAARPATPPVGFLGYNNTESVLQFYGGVSQDYYSIAHKSKAANENELIVSVPLTESAYGLKKYGGSAGYVRIDGSSVVTTDAVIPPEGGGTGISSYAIGDILYATATTTLSKRNVGSANRVLKSDGTHPVWSDYSITDGTNTFTIAKGTASFTLGAGQAVNGFIDDDTFVTATSTNFASSESIKAYIDARTYDNVSYRPPVHLLYDVAGSALGSTTNTIDGVTVTSGMRVLVVDSLTASQDYKIYLSSGSASSWVWTVQQDGTEADLPTDGDTVWVMQGTDHDDERWTFNGLEWVQVAGSGTYTGTIPIDITDGVISHLDTNGYKHIPAGGSSNEILKWSALGTATWGYVMNANISSVAAIEWSKMATLTANYAVKTDSAGVISVEQYLAVTRGGTGKGSWTQYGLVYNPTTTSFANINGGVGTVLTGTSTAPSFSRTPTLGVAASSRGELTFYHSEHAYKVHFLPSGVATQDQSYYFPIALPAVNDSVLVSNTSGAWSWQASTFAMDWKVKVDAGATADYIGDTASNGVLRMLGGIAYTDGGNFVTLGLDLANISQQLTVSNNDDRLAISDTSAVGVTKWITVDNLIKSTPGSVFGTQISFINTVSVGGWAGVGPYTITLKNTGAAGNGQQNHGIGADGKFMVLVYSLSGAILSETGISKTIDTGTGDIVIESSALFSGTIHLIHLA